MKSIFLSLVCLFLTSCASGPGPFRGKNLTRISLGMTKPEVVRLLGEPKSVAARENAETLNYVEDKGWWVFDHYFIRFVDGKVESYGPQNQEGATKP